jgi:hypothetical protein
MRCTTHPAGWLIIDIPAQAEKEAQAIRAERDAVYGNIFLERQSDLRWVGEIGEICFDWWLSRQANLNYRWIKDDAVGRPDFCIEDVAVGVKTVKRKVPVQATYTAQVTAKHAAEPVAHFFFASYEFTRKKLWLIGGIRRERFLQKARFYKAGEWVHSSYQIRPGHEIYNIQITSLTAPETWLKSLVLERESG